MSISGPRLRTLLRQAESVAENGKRAAALALYQQITTEAPDIEAAWLGIAELSTDLAEQETAYQRVLALNPKNERAQIGLAQMHGESVSSDSIATAAESTTETADPWQQPQVQPEDAVEPAQVSQIDKEPAAEPEPDKPLYTPDNSTYELFCYRHPNRSTALRCYSCGNPICSQCAIKTPVGYRCPDCIREAESVFFNAKAVDYIIAPIVSLPLSLLAGFLVSLFSGSFLFILITVFVSGIVGGFIGRVTKAAVGRRRGRYLPHIVAATVILGGLIPNLPSILILFYASFAGIMGLIMPGIYVFIASSAAFYQMK